jgi:hypothetical protein
VRLGTVGRGVDVRAAGQQQGVERLEHGIRIARGERVRRDHVRKPARGLDGVDVSA